MAFERDAFQEQAFQSGPPAKPAAPAFQADAFQGNAFQIGPPGSAAPPAVTLLLRMVMGMGV